MTVKYRFQMKCRGSIAQYNTRQHNSVQFSTVRCVTFPTIPGPAVLAGAGAAAGAATGAGARGGLVTLLLLGCVEAVLLSD